ncbi:MAG: polysaccharide pyruvyl transferase family protein [Halomonas sp.]|uniref:Polysaccharide pyruvyl transferase family protein n=1 Tax=Halomonas sulfidivorans TaxID=2733488 RepID=A0ABX7WGI2_9GAMM|nr:polysaccharide pyruvyl transferase family protein [Halomonas sulfidivorans]MDX5377243.1 polysaccharide pyruvyl transferase family protein [Halomonas sp.]QTP59156.1 polysaccharide pyruvyl transferase family protein [Halomonas sulfidivorans]
MLTVAKGKIPVVYFDKLLNVGDAITPFLVRRLTGKEAYRVHSNSVAHLLGVGSIIHQARSRSLVWGSGVIDPAWLPRRDALEQARYVALRGRLTQELLAERGADVSASVLGDPALIVPLLYQPSRSGQKFRIGLVPHYVDQDNPVVRYMAKLPGIKLIDVRQQPEPFIDELNQCDSIISSSLHGLILADCYRIPNLWVRFSDGITGGQFKFHDYYSTTDVPRNRVMPVADRAAADACIAALPERSGVAQYQGDPLQLAAAFPFTEFGWRHGNAWGQP